MNYMAPEILNFEPSDGRSDVWSACVVVFVLFSGRFPYDGESKSKVYEQILARELVKDLMAPNWAHVSNEAKDFILRGLHADPSSRLTSE